jgi:hypothetical protein
LRTNLKQIKPSKAKQTNLCLVLVASSKEEERNPHRYSSNPEPLMTVDLIVGHGGLWLLS